MEEGPITINKLCRFSQKNGTLITVAAPLFGSLIILDGKVLGKGSAVDAEKVGQSPGFPPNDEIVQKASRFWIMDSKGIRKLHDRAEMANLLT